MPHPAHECQLSHTSYYLCPRVLVHVTAHFAILLLRNEANVGGIPSSRRWAVVARARAGAVTWGSKGGGALPLPDRSVFNTASAGSRPVPGLEPAPERRTDRGYCRAHYQLPPAWDCWMGGLSPAPARRAVCWLADQRTRSLLPSQILSQSKRPHSRKGQVIPMSESMIGIAG
jgi:hypothetical protein